MAEISIEPCCIDRIYAAYSTEEYDFECECGRTFRIKNPSGKSAVGFLGYPKSPRQHQPDYRASINE